MGMSSLRAALLATRDLLGYLWVYPVHAWRSTPTVWRVAYRARRREGRR